MTPETVLPINAVITFKKGRYLFEQVVQQPSHGGFHSLTGVDLVAPTLSMGWLF